MSLSQVYPFATQDGKAIPLDIIKPSGLIFTNFTDSADVSITIPEGYPVAAIIANTACFIRFGDSIGTLVENTFYNNLLLIPSNTITIVSLIVGSAKVRGLTDSGSVYLQLIEKWAGLALDKQFIRK